MVSRFGSRRARLSQSSGVHGESSRTAERELSGEPSAQLRTQFSPLRVKRVVLITDLSLPIYPDKRTFSEAVGMSQRCHIRTHARSKAYCTRSPRRRWRPG